MTDMQKVTCKLMKGLCNLVKKIWKMVKTSCQCVLIFYDHAMYRLQIFSCRNSLASALPNMHLDYASKLLITNATSSKFQKQVFQS